VTYHWVDGSRPELFSPDPDDRRELLAQVWYPAEKVAGAMPGHGRLDAGRCGQLGFETAGDIYHP
jgi:hypothetical protein